MNSPLSYATAGVALVMLAILIVSRGTGPRDVDRGTSKQALSMPPKQARPASTEARSRVAGNRDQAGRAREEMAAHYRAGAYEKVDFSELEIYFRRRIGVMPVDELKKLLGEPRVVVPSDSYYLYALAPVYDDDGIQASEEASEGPQGQHDQVLHYGEYGPPEHKIPDESMNLFFVTKDDKIIGMRTLFP